MADNFYFSGLRYDGRWFSKNFEPYHLFGYVGDRDRFAEYLAHKSILRDLLELIIPRMNITSLLKTLSGFDLVSVIGQGQKAERSIAEAIKAERSIAEAIINTVNTHEHNRKLTKLLEGIYKKCKRRGTYFDGLGTHYPHKSPLQNAELNSIADQLIVIEGHLLHRDTVAQYSPSVSQSLEASAGEWVLGDFPPHGMIRANNDFKGRLVILKEDSGFTQIFKEHLPFCKTFGWYPYCRIVGFFDIGRLQTEVYPTLSVSLVEYRRPKIYDDVCKEIFYFMESENKHKIYLDDWSDLVLAGYLVPIVTWGSNMKQYKPTENEHAILKTYRASVNQGLPQALDAWYASALGTKPQ